MQFESEFQPRRRTLLIALGVVGAAAAVPTTYALLSREPPTTPKLHLTEELREYVDHFPRDGGYRTPTGSERTAVADAVAATLRGDRGNRSVAAQQQQQLQHIDYRLTRHQLAGSGREVAEIAEPTEHMTGTGRGWGRVYVDLSAPVRWSVQVPHPRSDLHTELIGADLFARVPGGVLVLAGAPRDAAAGRTADMAHRSRTVFNAVCDALVGRRVPALQVHGFADASSPGHDVVLSTGPAGRTPTAVAAADRIAAQGFEVCRAWSSDSGDCGGLEGRTNVQAGAAADLGVDFLHVENSYRLRSDPAARTRLVTALAEVARAWSG
ncbi:hypothetical protein GCM10022403_038130 [Streptomyces coacervatus]|uniref:N-acetylmuramoyl-L-alanine amidase n=1 Tax=Streptomyces coacervatus TaxID=647381 RepID=A0ABP7HNC4_9ACTN|nr:hypothetical protein [Streptomyces coacervatus]MDF2270774.1 hypothetical protein [Streptomyces coacervatus]